jgi:hypothetical protein
LGLTGLDGFAAINGSYGRDAGLFSRYPVRNGIHDQLKRHCLISLLSQIPHPLFLSVKDCVAYNYRL